MATAEAETHRREVQHTIKEIAGEIEDRKARASFLEWAQGLVPPQPEGAPA